jgi:hypothetical protein
MAHLSATRIDHTGLGVCPAGNAIPMMPIVLSMNWSHLYRPACEARPRRGVRSR